MRKSHYVVSYLFYFFVVTGLVGETFGGEHHAHYPSYETKHYGYEHHNPPPAKKSGHVDINIPIDVGSLAKLGILGLTQLKLLLALGKVAGAGLGVGALGLGSLGKLALSVAPVHKGIAIDLKPSHQAKYHHFESHHYPEKQHY